MVTNLLTACSRSGVCSRDAYFHTLPVSNPFFLRKELRKEHSHKSTQVLITSAPKCRQSPTTSDVVGVGPSEPRPARRSNNDRAKAWAAGASQHTPPPPHPSALSADPHHLWLVTHFGLGELHQKPHRFLRRSASQFRSKDKKARATLLARELKIMARIPPSTWAQRGHGSPSRPNADTNVVSIVSCWPLEQRHAFVEQFGAHSSRCRLNCKPTTPENPRHSTCCAVMATGIEWTATPANAAGRR